MIVFGLVGGIASGKSAVADFFRDHGAVVLDADQVAHQVLRRPEIVDQLVARWGAAVAPEGEPDRGRIAEIVFGPSPTAPTDLQWLESLIHPRVHEELLRQLSENRSRGVRFAVLDVPLLLERGWQQHCDHVLFIDTPDAIRRSRAARRGWDDAELADREARQWPLDRKRAAADAVIDNSGSLAELHERLQPWLSRE